MFMTPQAPQAPSTELATAPDSAVSGAVARLVHGKVLPRIHVLSDVHLESGPYEAPPQLECDIVVASGDIGPVEVSVPWLAKFGKPVVYVMGNHEAYGTSIDEALARAKELSKGTQVHVLENEAVELMGVRFLGTTLWTSYGKWSPYLVSSAYRRMNDFHEVKMGTWLSESAARQKQFWSLCRRARMVSALPLPDGQMQPLPQTLHPAAVYMRHKKAVKWLERMLDKKCELPTVVVTHHAPAYECLVSKRISAELLDARNWEAHARNDRLLYVAAYASDLKALLARHRDAIDLWTHGHIHAGQDLLVEGVRILANPRGRHIPPLTPERARAMELYGVRVTEKDIEESLAQAKAQPYLGNGSNFEPSLTLDLLEGPRRALQALCDETKPALAQLKEQARDLMPLVGKGEPLQAKAVARWLRDCVEQFSKAYSELLEKAFSHLHQFGSCHALSAPGTCVPAPYLPWDEEKWTAKALESVDQQAQRALNFLERLPFLPQTHLANWTCMAIKGLLKLEEMGVNAGVRLPSKLAWRRLDSAEVHFVRLDDKAPSFGEAEQDSQTQALLREAAGLDCEGADDAQELTNLQLEVVLDGAINGKPPRHWLVSVTRDVRDWRGNLLPEAFTLAQLRGALGEPAYEMLVAASGVTPGLVEQSQDGLEDELDVTLNW